MKRPKRYHIQLTVLEKSVMIGISDGDFEPEVTEFKSIESLYEYMQDLLGDITESAFKKETK